MYTIEILEKLFGSSAKVKIMRMFLFNPRSAYDSADIEKRAKVHRNNIRKEVALLENIGLLKKRHFFKTVEAKRRGKKVSYKKKTIGWTLNDDFFFLKPLQSFLIDSFPLKHADLCRRLNRTGKIKLLIIAGVFIQNPDSRVDLMIVGDNLKKNTLENTLRTMESEIGKELRYSYFDTEDFKYRLGMCDKLVRDVLDYPHEKVIDKIGAV